MNEHEYRLIFERYPLYPDSEPALEIGAWDNPWLKGENILYMDRVEYQGYPDVLHDLEDLPLPFEDQQFKMIAMREVLEHICPKNQIAVMNELHRILSFDGVLMLTVPYYKWHGAYSTPDHCKYFTEYSFSQYGNDNYNLSSKWRVESLVKVKEKDRLRYMPIQEGGSTIKRPFIRRVVYRLLSYSPFKRYTRNLFVLLEKVN